MRTLRRSFMTISVVLVIAAIMAACGSQPTSTGSTANNTMKSNTNSTMMGSTPTASMNSTPMPYSPMTGKGATPTPNGGMSNNNNNMNGDMNAFIHMTLANINGTKVHVLTTSKGFMLYYFKKDMGLTSNCTGMCAQNWPPLLAPKGMMTISSSVPLPRKLSVHKTANGEQVFYDGHALYTYAGDMTPGQFAGRGMDSAWYLVGATL